YSDSIRSSVATVGYGDQVVDLNNFIALAVACIVMIFGALYLAMPLAIIGIRYEMTWTTFEKENKLKIRAASNRSRRSAQESVPALQLASQSLAPMSNRVNGQYTALCDVTAQLSLQCARYVELIQPEQLVTGPIDESRNQSASQLIDTILRVLKAHKTLSKSIKTLVPRELLKPNATAKQPKLSNTSPSRHSTFKQSIISRAKRALSGADHADDPPHLGKDGKTLSLRRRLFLLLERPHSSRQANYVNKFLLVTVIMSVLLFYAETTPELQAYGMQSVLCHRAIKSYCTQSGRSVSSDPGCYVHTSANVASTAQLDFHCPATALADAVTNVSPCFGVGWNYGSNTSTFACATSFSDNDKICNLRQCQKGHVPMSDMTTRWLPIELYFAVIFTAEWLLRLYASRNRSAFFRTFGTWIDIVAITPFYAEIVTCLVTGLPPIFAIVPTFPTFLSVLPTTKTLRVLKLSRVRSVARFLKGLRK
ncbi:hypothetical protein As57867_007216, partial [Aphanomyces stellatus]